MVNNEHLSGVWGGGGGGEPEHMSHNEKCANSTVTHLRSGFNPISGTEEL